jgi:hypothetical protein
MRTVLGATLVTTITALMFWIGSYGYAFPQTPLEPSFQPTGAGHETASESVSRFSVD